MTTYLLSPIINGTTVFSTTDVPAAGGKIYTYLAGTTTAATTYQTINGTAQSNPIILNSAGQLAFPIWLNPSLTYKFAVYDSFNNLIATYDNISGIPNINTSITPIQTVNNIATLRTLNRNIFTQSIVLGYYSAGDGGGGTYYLDQNDNSSTDNGGTIIVANDGGIWKLSSSTVVSLNQFGAKGDGVTDDTTTIQNALTWAAANGKTLRAPSGTYVITAGLSATLNNGTSLNNGGRRLQLIGDGPGNTVFVYSGSSSPTLFTFTGNYFDRLLLQGFRVQHTDQASVGSNGIGIKILSAVNAMVRDVNVFRMTTGISCTDINSCKFDNCVLNYNSTGFVAQFGTVSYPNALTFSNCYFSSNYQNGCVIQNGVTVTFDACTFEANGLDNSGNVQAGATGMAFSNNGVNGAASLIVRGCYFEHNAGAADIYITHTATGTYLMEGCTFNRIDSVQYVSNNIVFDASSQAANVSPCKIKLHSNGFFRAGTYVANAGRKYINFAHGSSGYNQFFVNEEMNNYTDQIEFPQYSPSLDTRYGDFAQLQAQAYVAGASGTMSSNFGISSMTRASAGTYNVVLVRSVGTPMVSVLPGTGSLSSWISNVTSNSYTLNFANASGVATDPLFFIMTVFNGA